MYTWCIHTQSDSGLQFLSYRSQLCFWFFHARIAFVTEKCENINPEEDDIIDELDEGQIRYGFILLPLRD